MDIHIILVFCFASMTSQKTIPQVYEAETPHQASESNTRVVRDPSFARPAPTRTNYQPPTFNFQAALQQDHRKNRYAQQQRVDYRNIFRKGKEEVTANSTEKSAPTRGSRKLRPNSYYEDLEERQDDSQIIYVHPDLIKEHFSGGASERDISALNALIGQSPGTQLEGLRKLLEAAPQSSNFVLAPRDHTPISEDTVEVPSGEEDSGRPIIEEFQKHLDAAAQEHTRKVLAKAQHDAAVHVETQHRAIAKMQVEAQNAALGQINGYHPGKVVQALPEPEPEDQPYALPLRAPPSEAGTSPYASGQHQAAALLQAERAVFAQVHARNNAILNKNHPTGPPHKISITHSITQEHKAPTGAYQAAVLEAKRRIEPIVKPKVAKHDHDHPYASRYAFGYRIKDFKMGNDFGHEEKRDGKSAKGHYHVLLPDGRLQKVEYYADPTGYHAKVTYENVAHH